MVPETLDAGAVSLYRADPFPTRWVPVADLLPGRLADPSCSGFEDRWWMFACPAPSSHDALALFHADTLQGPWYEHPASPLITGDRSRARPGGRVVAWDGRLYRFCAGLRTSLWQRGPGIRDHSSDARSLCRARMRRRLDPRPDRRRDGTARACTMSTPGRSRPADGSPPSTASGSNKVWSGYQSGKTFHSRYSHCGLFFR